MKGTLLITTLALCAIGRTQTTPWQHEIVYQIFPRSFYDSNGDHIGDLNGIRQKLGFLQKLGVTSLLINPVFDSRLYHNYFADDFLKVDPSLGSNHDFFELIKAAHARKMKVILDMEVQYVADRHPWYIAAMGDKTSKYARYLWTTGSRLWGRKLRGYNGVQVGFATLDPSNSDVRNDVEKVFRYWADPDGNPGHGVDGFRIDHMMDDLDNQHEKTGMLQHFWLPIEQSTRKLNPHIFFLAEQSDWKYGQDLFEKSQVDAVYAIPLRFAWITLDRAKIVDALQRTLAATPSGKTQCVFIENHDVERYASVVKSDPRLLRLGAVFELTVPGTPLIYNGQELGMTGVQGHWGTDANDIPVRLAYRWTHLVQGPGSADFYRGSGPWASTSFEQDNDGISVEEEANSPASLLNFYRKLIALRKRNVALTDGSFRVVDVGNPRILAYQRLAGQTRVFVVMNLSDSPQPFVPVADWKAKRTLLSSDPIRQGQLAPHGYLILESNSR